MSKITKDFQFSIPYKKSVVENLRLKTVVACYLTVAGKGYFYPEVSVMDVENRYKVDIDFVCYEGKDIKVVLDALGEMDSIEEKAVQYFANRITETLKAA